MCGVGSWRTTETARATSTAEIGEVLPPPIGSASSSASRTPGAAKSRKNPSMKTVGRMVTSGRPAQGQTLSPQPVQLVLRAVGALGDAHLRNGHLRHVHEGFDAAVARHGGGVDRGRQVIGLNRHAEN